jgi:hypothetical protein
MIVMPTITALTIPEVMLRSNIGLFVRKRVSTMFRIIEIMVRIATYEPTLPIKSATLSSFC